MIVVSNTSPITNLAAVGQLQLLQQLYNNIIVPAAVYFYSCINSPRQYNSWCNGSADIKLDSDANSYQFYTVKRPDLIKIDR